MSFNAHVLEAQSLNGGTAGNLRKLAYLEVLPLQRTLLYPFSLPAQDVLSHQSPGNSRPMSMD